MKFPFIAFHRNWFTYVLVTGYETDFEPLPIVGVKTIVNKDFVIVYEILDDGKLVVYNCNIKCLDEIKI